jgi:hypothetical protein
MPARSMVDVLAALARRAFDEIIGCPEGREVDFKRAPYDLNQTKGKWELAKDVAAFANGGGGLIVIGIEAEKTDNHLSEIATKVRPVRKSSVDSGKYRAAITNGIAPLVVDVELRWFPEDDTINDGVLVIRVPAQAEASHPFVLRRTVDDAGVEVPAFAIPRRNEDQTEWTTAEHVHGQLAMLSLLSRRGVAASGASDARRADLEQRFRDLASELDAMEEPCFGIQVIPSSTLDLTTRLFGESGIAQALARWEGIRRNGFNLRSREPEARGSSLLFGSRRWRGRIDVDGVFSVVVPARWDFLGWGMNKESNPARAVRVNAVVLVEFTYDCLRFASRVLAPYLPSDNWSARVHVWRMKTAGVLHQGGQRGRWDYEWDEARTASSDDYAPPPMTMTGRPEKDAFDMLTRVYALWGLGPAEIPYSREGEVDPAAIVALRG